MDRHRTEIGPLPREKVQRYATTVLEIGRAPALRVDLRERLTEPEVAAVQEAAGAAGFTVITAANPGGLQRSEQENRRARQALRKELEAVGTPFVPVLGRDPEGTHREEGFGVAGRLEPVLELARRFGQDGLFRFQEGRFLLVETATGRTWPLP